jgi:NDP-sugar pyrophosphorylase family protein
MIKILLLATAEKPKLRPLTEELPAPLLPITNRPVMMHTIDMLARQGYKQMLVSLHHQAGFIESFFYTGQRWGVSLEYLLQRQPFGNAGSLLWGKSHLNSTFLVLPADILIDLNIEQALAQHRQQGNAVTIITHEARMKSRPWPNAPAWQYQEIGSESEGPVETGAFLCEPQVLSLIPPRTPFDILNDLLPCVAKNNLPVAVHKMNGYWNPLDTFEDYRRAQHIFLRSAPKTSNNVRKTFQHLSIPNKPVRDGVWIGRNSLLHPTSRLIPPVYIGENCRIGKNVEIGPDTVIGQNVIVDDEATISDSTILDGTYIGRLIKVQNKVARKNLVIDIPSASAVQIVDEHLLAPTLQSLEESQLLRALDILIALLLLLVTLPLTFPLAILLFLVNGRLFDPVERVQLGFGQAKKTAGQNGSTKCFRLLRFATSRKTVEGSDQTETKAPLWSLNRFVKQWNLNRLPELWNVVRGDMCMVGVKPISQAELLFMKEKLAAGEVWREKVYECPAGFTGLWFVQVLPAEFPDEELIADAYYSAIRSWRLDLTILRQTPAAWYRRTRQTNPTTPARLNIAKEGG